ncbi:hypothetical protein DW657_12260 [Prevotella sp. AM23-5]|nr:hypothetical protein DW657_12260 [Prevotella sp. AM23-5]
MMDASLSPCKGKSFLSYVKKFFEKKSLKVSFFYWKCRLKDLVDNKIKRMRLLGFGAEKSH